MEEWLANPVLMEADADAEYAEIIEIDLNEIKEPIVAAPMTRIMLSCCPKLRMTPCRKYSSVLV
jgi:aconitase B